MKVDKEEAPAGTGASDRRSDLILCGRSQNPHGKYTRPQVETVDDLGWGSIPIAYLAAKNISPFYPLAYGFGRGVIVLSRSTHEIIFALLFVSALGLGPLPGILALGCRSVGFMAKTTAEAIENIIPGPPV